jgi:hypothetical protein
MISKIRKTCFIINKSDVSLYKSRMSLFAYFFFLVFSEFKYVILIDVF